MLKKKGFHILDTNLRLGRLGEVDILAEDQGMLVIVEVKTRRSLQFGLPKEALTRQKKEHLRRLAEALWKKEGKKYKGVRIDLVSLLKKGKGWEVEHIPNALGEE